MPKLSYHPDFDGVIPAQYSVNFNRLFAIYSANLFRRRFDSIYIDGTFRPGSLDRTVWYMNHHTWWDALIPNLLNSKVFHQDMRAIMDEEQLRKYPFFRKLGAFSVDRSHPRSALNALEYAVDALQQDHSSLYIFPQGKIEPEFIDPMKFEGGLAWLYRSLPNVDFVPIATTMNTRYSDKPRLLISIGTPLRSNETDRKKLTGLFEQSITDVLSHIRDIAEHEHPLIDRLL